MLFSRSQKSLLTISQKAKSLRDSKPSNKPDYLKILSSSQENPIFENILMSQYDKHLHTVSVLCSYLQNEVNYLNAILLANKGKLKDDHQSDNLNLLTRKSVNQFFSYAENDIKNADHHLAITSERLKEYKKNKNIEKKPELKFELQIQYTAAKKNMEEKTENFNRLARLQEILVSIKPSDLTDTVKNQLKNHIKILNLTIDNLTSLIDTHGVINTVYSKYESFLLADNTQINLWGKSSKEIQDILNDNPNSKIDVKELLKYDAKILELQHILNSLPRKGQYLDDFLEVFKTPHRMPDRILE